MPKVSILMGIYNCAPTLREAVESILSQTFTDWELILCEDGSRDDTYAIAQEYRRAHPDRIILLRNEKNMGLNHTLNRCLQAASGEYCARMDGDDLSLPDRFEKQVAFLDAHPEYAIVSTPMIFFDEQGEWGRNQMIERPQRDDFIHHSPVHCHAPCMIRREAYLAVGGYTEDLRMLRFEDVNLWYKLYAAGYQGYNLSEPLYMMRDGREAAGRRGLRSRMNGVYVTYVGFRLFRYPWYMYRFVVLDFIKHFIKGAMPEKLYLFFHKRSVNQSITKEEQT